MSLKRNIKALGLALVAVVAFGAIAAAAAQATAPRFTVAGSTTFSKQTITGSNEGAVTLNNPSRNLKLESVNNGDCTTHGFITSSTAGVPSSFDEVTLTCKNVKVFISGVDRTALCPTHSPEAASGTVVTKDTDGKLVWTAASGATSAGMTFTPEAGVAEPFTELQITGATCPLATGGTNLKVLGNAIATNDTPTGVDATTQKIVFPATADTKYWTNQTPTRTEDTDSGLTLGGTAATFAGTFTLHLPAVGEPPTQPSWGIEAG